MTPDMITPTALPTSRILGEASPQRRDLLSCIDVVVGYVAARHRITLAGWRLEAALVEDRPGFRGGETVALRATPLDGRSPADLPPVPLGVLREIGSRITDSFQGIANVVPDVASTVPDVDGLFAVIDIDDPWLDDAATA
jgi:GMP synthase PP-ATPase subunit